MAKKILVAYFSCEGNTKMAAEYIKEALGADIAEIAPAEPYTKEDLDYMNPGSRSCKEHADASIKPALKAKIDVSGYEVVFVGYPIWWSDAPNIVNGFVESAGLDGKVVVPFCTSHSTGLEESDVHLHKFAPTAKWGKGKGFWMNPDKAEVVAWAKGLQL